MRKKELLYGIIALVVVALAALLVGRSAQQAGNALDVLEHGPTRDALTAVRDIIARRNHREDSLRALARRTQAAYARVRDSLNNVETRDDSVFLAIRVIGPSAETFNRCVELVSNCGQRVAVFRAMADSLNRRVTDLLSISKRRCGLFAGFGIATINGNIHPGAVVGFGCSVL